MLFLDSELLMIAGGIYTIRYQVICSSLERRSFFYYATQIETSAPRTIPIAVGGPYHVLEMSKKNIFFGKGQFIENFSNRQNYRPKSLGLTTFYSDLQRFTFVKSL